MTNQLSKRTRATISDTLPLVGQHRADLEEALERHMASHGPHEPNEGRTKVLAWAIIDMLLGHARQIVERDASLVCGETAERHRVLALGGEYYPWFGDTLQPVMRDVLGDNATPSVLAAWGDAYWAIVRSLDRSVERLAA